jgi:hypothetical protein
MFYIKIKIILNKKQYNYFMSLIDDNITNTINNYPYKSVRKLKIKINRNKII